MLQPKVMRRYEQLGARSAWAIALLAPLAAAASMVALRNHTQAGNLALVEVAVVAATAVPGFRLAAIAAGMSAGVSFDFFLTRPYETFSIIRSSDIQTAVLMTVVAAIVGLIAARRREAGEKAQRSGDEVLGLYVTAQMLSAGSRADVIVGRIAEQLQSLLFLSGCEFDSGRPSDTEPMINRAGEMEWAGHSWSPRHHGWPSAPVSLPMDRAGQPVGRFLLHGPATGGPVTLDRLLTALALADLAGAAIDREGTRETAIAP